MSPHAASPYSRRNENGQEVHLRTIPYAASQRPGWKEKGDHACLRPRRRALLFWVVLGVLLVACGIPADRKPEAIPMDQVPFGLLSPPTSQPATTLPSATTPQTVYMVRADRLVALTRTVGAPATLGSVLGALIQGPSDGETTNGVRSAINSQASVLSIQISDGVASINLSDAFTGLGVSDQILALGQIVYTATEMPGITAVRLSIDSAITEVPRGDGSTTRESLRRIDYERLVATPS